MGILHLEGYSEAQLKKQLRKRFLLAQVAAVALWEQLASSDPAKCLEVLLRD
jgi:hypothetical protein